MLLLQLLPRCPFGHILLSSCVAPERSFVPKGGALEFPFGPLRAPLGRNICPKGLRCLAVLSCAPLWAFREKSRNICPKGRGAARRGAERPEGEPQYIARPSGPLCFLVTPKGARTKLLCPPEGAKAPFFRPFGERSAPKGRRRSAQYMPSGPTLFCPLSCYAGCTTKRDALWAKLAGRNILT